MNAAIEAHRTAIPTAPTIWFCTSRYPHPVNYMHIGPHRDRDRVLNRVCFGARLCAQLWAEMYAQFGVQFGVRFCCGTPKWKDPIPDPILDPIWGSDFASDFATIKMRAKLPKPIRIQNWIRNCVAGFCSYLPASGGVRGSPHLLSDQWRGQPQIIVDRQLRIKCGCFQPQPTTIVAQFAR